MKNKKILFYSYAPKLHSCYNSYFSHAPEWYEFQGERNIVKQELHKKLNKGMWFSNINRYFLNFLDTTRIRDILYSKKQLPPHDLLFSTWHLCHRKEPWILDADMVSLLTGYDVKRLEKRKKRIEKLLLSDECKKIIPCTEKSRETFTSFFKNEEISKKIQVIYPTRPSNKGFIKKYDWKKVRLLYVGSANFPHIFVAKWWRETLLAYKKLSEKYGDAIELFMATKVPDEFKHLTQGVKNLIIDDTITLNTGLDKVFETSDIFLQPAHYFALMAPLDAMSYELPIISTNIWAIPEYVQHEYNGLLIEGSKNVNYKGKYSLPNYSKSFYKWISEIDDGMIEDLVKKTSLLIDNPELRKQYWKNGRAELEKWKFSIDRRNKLLSDILEKSI